MKFKITFTLLVLGLVGQAFGCKCDGPDRTLKQSFNGHSVIVHGRVISLTLIPFQRTMNASKADYVRRRLINDKENLKTFLSDSVYEIRLLVKESFKGSGVGDTLTIYTRTGSCGVPFQLEQDYIVYTLQRAWHYHGFLTELLGQEKFEKENTYYAHRCTRTTLYDKSEASALRQLRNSKD
jgi:hypothetical protein